MNELKGSYKSANTINGARQVLTEMCKGGCSPETLPLSLQFKSESVRFGNDNCSLWK